MAVSKSEKSENITAKDENEFCNCNVIHEDVVNYVRERMLEQMQFEKLYFNGTSPTETREKADVLLSEVSAMLDDEDFTENDKTTFFSCIAEKYFAGKAKNHKETIDNAV